VVLLTLAIGIGANTAVFSVINGVLLKPLPYPGADRLLGVWHDAPGINIPGVAQVNCSPSMYFTYLDENRAFASLGLWQTGTATITGLGEPEQVPAVRVTDATIRTLGATPALGRGFTREDDTPGTPETVILAHGYWQRRFGGDPGIVGRGITVDARPREIIGVLPEGFRLSNAQADLFVPLRFDRSNLMLGNFSFQGVARLKPEVTLDQANSDVRRMIGIWLKAWPVPPGFDAGIFENARFGPALHPLKQDVVGDVGGVLWVLMGTIGIVLLIACANVANLLLVRAEARQQELAIRAALGAGWARLAKELLLESLTLGVLGGVLGVGVAYAALRLLVWIRPASLPRLDEITIDPAVFAFALMASLASGLLFGMLPVLKHAGPDISKALRGGGRTASHGKERHRARNTLVVIQVALALMLLVGSGLMVRTFQALRRVEPGFTAPDHIQTVRLMIPEGQVREPERVTRMQQDILDRIGVLPGVSGVSFSSAAPLEPFNSNDVVFVEGKAYAEGQIPPIRRFKFVAPGFFDSVGTRLVAGRDLTWTDLYDYRPVVVISENLARELWSDPSAALGKRVRESPANPWREVIGVVANVHDDGVDKPPPSTLYLPALLKNIWGNATQSQRAATFTVRTPRAGSEALLSEVRKAVWAANPNLPLARVRTLAELYDGSMARTSFTLVMLGIAAGMALILGIIGIYGVISYGVAQRKREIGIRMALGSQPVDVTRLFVRDGLVLAAVGILAGLAVALALSRVMSSLLFGTSALDATTYAAMSLVMAGAAALASYLPARRAAAMDPSVALRAE
jgi:predicted permease